MNDASDVIREVRFDEFDKLKAIVEIYNSYIQNFKFPIDEIFLKDSLRDKNFKIFVYENNSIKGFCGIYFCSKNTAEIGPIAVDKRFLKKHIGSKLLEYVLNFAKEKGVKECTARVLEKNLNAVKFFTDKGFVEEMKKDSIVYLNLKI